MWFIVIGQAKCDSNTVYYFSDPTTLGYFSLSLSLPLQILPIQDVLKEPKANTDLLYFSALSYFESSVKKMSLYLLSHFRIRIIVLTCPDNKSARSQPTSCVPAMQNHTNHNDARPILFQLKSSLPFSLFLFVWRVPPLNLYYDISIQEDLQCLKAVNGSFVRNGGTTRTHSSLCS